MLWQSLFGGQMLLGVAACACTAGSPSDSAGAHTSVEPTSAAPSTAPSGTSAIAGGGGTIAPPILFVPDEQVDELYLGDRCLHPQMPPTAFCSWDEEHAVLTFCSHRVDGGVCPPASEVQEWIWTHEVLGRFSHSSVFARDATVDAGPGCCYDLRLVGGR